MGQTPAPMFPAPGPIGPSTAQNIVAPAQPLAKAPKQSFVAPQTEFPGVKSAPDATAQPAPQTGDIQQGGGYDPQFQNRAMRQFYGY